ncbi:MAG TPA: hypothetical protein VFK86_10795 [Bauldia sp.]|nr:hypothetical protein [Bauldia sp.]
MTDPYDEQGEKPLDPEVARVQQRLRRLMLISGLTLGLGILAVFLAIVYRLVTWESGGTPVATVEGAAVPTVSPSALGLPADARLVSTSLDGDRVALAYEDSGGSTIVVFDLDRMVVVSRFRVAGD